MTPQPSGFVTGYNQALRQWELSQECQHTEGDTPLPLANPYPDGSEESRGFEEAVHDLTQK